jgi:uncharacterized protein (TIGR04255 family)
MKMKQNQEGFSYPKDVNLNKSPLIEAWMEFRWKLEEGRLPHTLIDKKYPFALGVFYNNVKDKFSYHEELPASNAPEGFLPHKVQHRFRVGKNKWPVLQLGPGVASANFVKDYTWDKFYSTILYLRENLLEAYRNDLNIDGLFLRYRNGFPFDYEAKDPLSFLQDNLNISVSLPKHIPGSISSIAHPIESHMGFVFKLQQPVGIGRISINSGTSKLPNKSEQKIIVLEFEVRSTGSEAFNLDKNGELEEWLNSSHSAIHEWFMSFIDGPLYEEFSGG